MKSSSALFFGSAFIVILLLRPDGGSAAIHESKGVNSIIDVGRRRHPPQLLFGTRNKNVAVDVERSIATTSTSPALSITTATTPPPSSSLCCARGGACSDSTPALFAKVALGAAAEASLMYGVLNYAAGAADADALGYSKTIVVRSIQAACLLLVIFGSAYFGAVVDNGLSAATRQVLDPNKIPGDEDWYANLKKPSWNPPGWVFPIMWLIVSKPTQFAGVWKLITQNNGDKKDLLSIPLAVYCGHLSLGDAWNKVFFGLECTGRGLVVILAFWSALVLSAYSFYSVDPIAGLLLVPTCLWVTVATALIWSIYLLNKDSSCG